MKILAIGYRDWSINIYKNLAKEKIRIKFIPDCKFIPSYILSILNNVQIQRIVKATDIDLVLIVSFKKLRSKFSINNPVFNFRTKKKPLQKKSGIKNIIY